MISYQDVALLLMQMESEGFEVKSKIKELFVKKEVPLSTLKFINDNRPLDCYKFIEKIRKSYNKGSSKLYKNIVSEVEKPRDVLTTLASLQLQILIFLDDVEDKNMFLSHMRFDEIQNAFTQYYNSFDLIYANRLIQYLKADFKVWEMFRKEGDTFE